MNALRVRLRLLLSVLLLPAFAARAGEPFEAKHCSNDTNITWGKLKEDRFPPSFPIDETFPACVPVLTGMLDKWRNADLLNWDRIANEYCSHASGWVETSPGICSAGGPPPICPEKHHWVQDPHAMDRYQKQARELREQRRQELKNAVCACMGQQLQASQPQQATVAPALPSAGFDVCSTDGDCPPGLKCLQNSCTVGAAVPSRGSGAIEFAKDKATDLAKDKLGEFAKQSAERMAGRAGTVGTLARGMLKVMKVTGSAPAQILFGVMHSPEFATNRSLYLKGIEDLEVLSKSYTTLEQQIEGERRASTAGARPSHGRCYYRASLNDLKQRLGKSWGTLESGLVGMKTEGEFQRNECPEVAQSVARAIQEETAQILSIDADSLLAGLPERGIQDGALCK